ncbi:MAG: transposase [Guyparkeria sp.]
MHCPHCESKNMARWGKHHDGRQRWKCRGCGRRSMSVPAADQATGSQLKEPASALRRAKRYIVTSAQNDTQIHGRFWRTLQQIAEHRGARLLVIPVRYKNPDRFHQGADADMSWPPEVLPHLLDRDLVLNRSLAVMGDAKINATAANPLAGMETLSGTRSAIFGHGQVQMRMVPTPHRHSPKMVHTTGSVSKPNYSRSKAGKRGRFNHSLGAVYLETQGDAFWCRELIAGDDGIVHDLDHVYDGQRILTGQRVEGLVIGDEHVKFMDPAVRTATFDDLVPRLRPRHIVRHDLHDHYSQSHHHEGDTILKVHKAHNRDWSVADELQLTVDHLINTDAPGRINWVVDANHNRHLRQWLNRYSANADPHNALIAWELQGLVAAAITEGRDPDPFRLYLEKHLPADVLSRVRFVNPNDELLIAGIDCSQHGDRGPNGARPTLRGFARASHKMFTAHSHTPGIEQGAWAVGVSAPEMAYAQGLSSWMTTHGVIFPNGKRQLVHIVNGQYERADAMREHKQEDGAA